MEDWKHLVSAEVEKLKLEQLRQDIRDGLNSGESTPWDAEEIKREGLAGRKARKAAGSSSKDGAKAGF